MKTLKFRFGLFSLLAVLAVSVFLTSCEQDVITDQTTTLLNQEQLVSAFEQDENVAHFAELTTQRRAAFIEKIKENEVDIDALKALHIAGDYDAMSDMLGIDATESEAQNQEIQQLAAQIRNDHAALIGECISCADNIQDIDAQYEALQTVMNTELEMRGCSWRFYACILGCQALPPGYPTYYCEFWCYIRYCD